MIVLALVATSACSAGAGADADGDAVVIQVPADPGSLDPLLSSTGWGRAMMRMSYDTLVAKNADGKIVSQLAESWKVTAGEATFKIRDGVKCSDGENLTAAVVAKNFEKLKDPAAKAPFTGSFLGSTDYSVTADKASNTLTLKLPKPFSPLLSNLTTYPGILCQSGLDDPVGLGRKSAGSGPYILTSAAPGRSYAFKANPHYAWGPGGATSADLPKQVKIDVVENETTAANLMLAGDLGLGVFREEGAFDRLRASRFTTALVPSSATFVHFNFLKDSSPVQDIRVRRAIAGVLDRAAMSSVVTGSADQVTNSVALPQSTCQSDVTDEGLVQFDVPAAERSLTEAGWAKRGDKWVKNGRPLTVDVIVSGPAAPAPPVADYALDAWTKAGIKVNLQNVDQATGAERRAEGDYDVWVGAWTGVLDPAIISPFLTSPESPTHSYVANDKYARLAKQAYAQDPGSTCPIWAEAQQALNEQVSLVPMFYDATHLVTAKGIAVRPYASFIDPSSLRRSK
ncbi:ABC transporter substrate-binding protein [Streptomyces sp. NPDC058665]|uniref:ABC transporter substrate-binding protein n=1 Tax=Streptomyces sp. NPDC058665 TaxID=3346586 RepID=UPI00364D5E05